MTLYSMTLDVLLAVLLVIAILYCWRLDQKLKTLRTGGEDMVEAARELQISLTQAQAAIEQLRRSADGAGRDLQGRIEEARAVSQHQAETLRPQNEFALRRRSSI